MAWLSRIGYKAVKHFFLASFIMSFILFGLAYYSLIKSNPSSIRDVQKLQMLPLNNALFRGTIEMNQNNKRDSILKDSGAPDQLNRKSDPLNRNKKVYIEQLRSEEAEIKELENQLADHRKQFEEFIVRFQQKINQSRLRNLEYLDNFEQERIRNKFTVDHREVIELQHIGDGVNDKLKSITLTGDKNAKSNNETIINDNHEGHYHKLFDHSNTSREVRATKCMNCMDLNFPFIINEEGLCESDQTIELVILISVSLYSSSNRQAIRKTWGSLCNNRQQGRINMTMNVRCVFLLAKQPSSTKQIYSFIREESREYKDIVLIDFIDSYANLTYKTLMGLKWVQKFCSNAEYVMKTDGDVFVNTAQIPIMLKAAPQSNFIGGHCWGISSPHRAKSSKWHVPYHLYPEPKFPPMCSGPGYIMSGDLAQKIVATAKNIPYFYLEDVYLALCLEKIGVLPVYLAGFSNVRQEYGVCNYRFHILMSHGFTPEELQHDWNAMALCPFEHIPSEELYFPLPYPKVY